MYKRKIKEDLDCGLYVTMKVFGSKWKPCIIDAIARGAKRPSEIHKQFTTASPRVIEMQLKELLDFGVVRRKNQSGYPLYVEYSLTTFGESILPVLEQMARWGEAHKEFVKERNNLILEGHHDISTSAETELISDNHNTEMVSMCGVVGSFTSLPTHSVMRRPTNNSDPNKILAPNIRGFKS